jgi:hypothetical protein
LRAGRQSAEQKIAGTRAAARAADALVGFGLVDGAADVNRARDGGIGLSAFARIVSRRWGRCGIGLSAAFEAIECPWRPRYFVASFYY